MRSDLVGRKFLLVLCTLMTAVSLGCGQGQSSGDGGGLNGKLTLTGSSTVAPLAAELAKRFEQLHPDVRIDVQSGGSGKGISDARSGVADIGMASRALKDGESDLTAHQIAADGVGLIVHSSNPVSELTNEQVVAIYTDQVAQWNEVGGGDVPITVVHKAEGRATLEVFLAHFQLKNPAVTPDVIVGDNEHGVKTVAGSEGAIGYVSIGTAEADVKAGVPIRLMPVAGVAATTANVAAGKFPMSRPLNFVTGDDPSLLSIAFIEFCQSKEVHDLIVSQYFVPIQR
ncbi:MAG: phosphate ABC transporter substrate-binding protein [Fuerstiella sp.]